MLAAVAALFWCKERQKRRKLQFNPSPLVLQTVHRFPNVMYAPAGKALPHEVHRVPNVMYAPAGGGTEHPDDHVYDAGNQNRGRGYGARTGAARTANGSGGRDQIVYTSDALATYAIPLDAEQATAPLYSVPKGKGAAGGLLDSNELATGINGQPSLGSNKAYEGYSVWEQPEGAHQPGATGDQAQLAANTMYEAAGSNGNPPLLGSNKAYEGYSVWERPAANAETGAHEIGGSIPSNGNPPLGRNKAYEGYSVWERPAANAETGARTVLVHKQAAGTAGGETTGSKIVYAVPLEDHQVVGGGVAGSSVVYAMPIEDQDGTVRGRYLSIASGNSSSSPSSRMAAIAGMAPQDTLPKLTPAAGSGMAAIAGMAPQDTLPKLTPAPDRRMTQRSPAPQNGWLGSSTSSPAKKDLHHPGVGSAQHAASSAKPEPVAIGRRRVTLRAGGGEDVAGLAQAATTSVYDAGGGRRGNASNA